MAGSDGAGRVTPIDRSWLWLAALLACCAGWTMALDCAVPVAAVAALAMWRLGPARAAGAAAGLWAVDAVVQHFWLGVAWDPAWAAVMLAVGLGCTLAARIGGLAGAFVAYEAGLYAGALWLGGTEAFGAGVVARAALINLGCFVVVQAVGGREGPRSATQPIRAGAL